MVELYQIFNVDIMYSPIQMPWKRSGNEVERSSMCVSCVISRGYDDRMTKNDVVAEKKETAYRTIFSFSIKKMICLFEFSVLISFHHRSIRIQKSCDEVSRARARGARVTQFGGGVQRH